MEGIVLPLSGSQKGKFLKEAEHVDEETSGLVRTAACSPASRTGGTGERQADRNQSCCWAKTPDACSRFHAAKASFIPRGSFLDKKLIKVCVSVGGGGCIPQAEITSEGNYWIFPLAPWNKL